MTELAQCRRCGKEAADGQEGYCPDCAAEVRNKRRSSRWFLASAVVGLLLVGVVYAYGELNPRDYSWDALMGRPAAIVNDEPIGRSAARQRIEVGKRMLEREYGKDLFSGDRGKALLAELERDVLEKMVEERLVAQEARRLNVTVSDALVEQEMQRIGSEVYGSWEQCRTSLSADGISPEDLAGHVRNLLLFREVSRAKAAPGADPDRTVALWLVQARQEAKIILSTAVAPRRVGLPGVGSCCSSGYGASSGGCGGRGGGCGQPSSAGPVAQELKEEAGAAALAEYRKTEPAAQGVEARVTDYGCHLQVDVEKEGRVLKSYAYQDGQISEN
ncbi:MAG: SurA N-terminal domain-containing protein [Syntrophales bacterium]